MHIHASKPMFRFRDRAHAPAHLCIAAPVVAPQALASLHALADEVVAVLMPIVLRGIGAWYEDFSQLSDEEVLAYLQARS